MTQISYRLCFWSLTGLLENGFWFKYMSLDLSSVFKRKIKKIKSPKSISCPKWFCYWRRPLCTCSERSVPNTTPFWNMKWLLVCMVCLCSDSGMCLHQPSHFLIHLWAWNTCSRVEVCAEVDCTSSARTSSFFVNINSKTVTEKDWD